MFVATERDDWTYLLVTPDGVAAGAVGLVLDRVLAHGLNTNFCLTVGLDVASMQEFYGGSPSFRIQDPGKRDFQFSWDTHEALYALAPACLVTLTASGGDAVGRMLRCKGRTRPELAEPDSVRWLGENVVFNLVHCPDDLGSARRELELLLGADEACLLMSAPTPLRPELASVAGEAALAASLPAAGDWESVSFPAIANRIRRRVVQRLAVLLGHDATVLRSLFRAQALLDAERGRLAAGTTSRMRLLTAISANSAICAELAAVVTALGDDVLTRGLDALSDLFDLRAPRRPEAVLALAHRGVYIGPLERVIVSCHAHAFRPNAEIDELY